MIQLGVSGDVGSFSEEAALLYAKQKGLTVVLDYLIDMEGVLAALDNQEIEVGILPVVNLNGGLVKPALEAMDRHLFLLMNCGLTLTNACCYCSERRSYKSPALFLIHRDWRNAGII